MSSEKSSTTSSDMWLEKGRDYVKQKWEQLTLGWDDLDDEEEQEK